MIGKVVKFIIDTFIHGRILYDIYGLGWQLVAAFWDSVTSWLTHRHQERMNHPHTEDAEHLEGVAIPPSAPDPNPVIYPLLPPKQDSTQIDLRRA
uniref:Putative glycoprotein n=1 Tax=Atrato Chu-like virus 1 TaxID=2689322 RepID=A0A6B9KGP0_9VIRU|nr:putative glycoprotein [Atrato Chu-like virus 1]